MEIFHCTNKLCLWTGYPETCRDEEFTDFSSFERICYCPKCGSRAMTETEKLLRGIL